jgi:hypothetical protein
MSEGMNFRDWDILADLRRIIRAVNLEGKRVFSSKRTDQIG